MQNYRAGRANILKRKRSHVLRFSGAENEPLPEEQCSKFYRNSSNEDVESFSSDERVPLTVICDNLKLPDKSEDNGTGETEPSNTPASDFELPGTSNSSPVILKSTPNTMITILKINFTSRTCQLPTITWADEIQLWNYLNTKDLESKKSRNANYFYNHSSIHHRMRSVLLEWLIEVCTLYKLHRETYYLAVDYIDRYLTKTVDISKNKLQLIGVTCLFMASKFEEIHPPRITEFAYITDGACLEADILIMELRILEVLKWHNMVVTTNTWLTILLQVLCHKDHKMDLIMDSPIFPLQLYDNAAKLLDLCSLDNGFLIYSYKTMAVSALYLSGCKNAALKVADMKYYKVCACLKWMLAFWRALQIKFNTTEIDYNLRESSPSSLDNSEEAVGSWDLCKHLINLDLLESAQEIMKTKVKNRRQVPTNTS